MEVSEIVVDVDEVDLTEAEEAHAVATEIVAAWVADEVDSVTEVVGAEASAVIAAAADSEEDVVDHQEGMNRFPVATGQ